MKSEREFGISNLVKMLLAAAKLSLSEFT